MGSAATRLLLSLVVAPQIKNVENLQASLQLTTLVFVVIGSALYLFTFFTARETVHRDARTVGLRTSLRTLRQNTPLQLLCVSSLFFLTAMFSIQTIGVYYARDVRGDANFHIVLTALQTGLMFLIAPVVPFVVRTVGKRAGYMVVRSRPSDPRWRCSRPPRRPTSPSARSRSSASGWAWSTR